MERTQEISLVNILVNNHVHESLVAVIDSKHRVIQVALDAEYVYILPQYRLSTEGKWYGYLAGMEGIVYYKRVSSGYYQAQQAKNYILDSLNK